MSGNSRIRSADSLILPDVRETLARLELSPEDAAAGQLARRYAAAIDAAITPADVLNDLGPKLLAVLEALGATPRARAAVVKSQQPAGPSKLSALRLARQT